MNELDLEERARDFWAGTALSDEFPRRIEQAIALKLPVTVVKLPIVTIRAVGLWLKRRHRRPVFPTYDRDLMGCLYADGGHGFIFLCGADEPEEQRFTLAHDTAHFLVDYWWPRLRIIQALGSSVVEVLDGHRAARPEERVSALFARLRIGSHWHLLPRSDADAETDPRIACVEGRADDLGLELVAPRARIMDVLQTQPMNHTSDPAPICCALGSLFGLPDYVFRPIVVASLRERTPTFLDDVLRACGRES